MNRDSLNLTLGAIIVSYTIYVGSEYYGFGPTSGLFVILRTLQEQAEKQKRKIQIRAVKNKGMEIFHSVNKDIPHFHMVEKLDPRKADLVFSSYDPFLIMEAWLHDVPSILFCNLLWFWKVKGKEEKIRQYRDELYHLKETDKTQVIPKFAQILQEDPNIGMYLGYVFANQCFARKATGLNLKTLPLIEEINITLMPPLISKFNFEDNLTVKKQVFFQLSGSENLTSTFEQNKIHITFCWKFMCDLAQRFPEYQFVFCVNPNLYEKIKLNYPEALKNITVLTTLSQRDNQYYMKTSIATFVSSGLCTLYEAANEKCPVFLLPEQNIGQHPNYLMLQKAGYNAPGILIGELFLDGRRLDYPEAKMIFEYIEGLTHHETNEEFAKKYMNSLELASNFINAMQEEKNREAHTENNHQAIAVIAGENGLSAGEEIAACILRTLQHTKRSHLLLTAHRDSFAKENGQAKQPASPRGYSRVQSDKSLDSPRSGKGCW